MTDFSSFFPSGGGGGGTVINNFQTGSAPYELNQMMAYSIVADEMSTNAIGNPVYGMGNTFFTYPQNTFNTYTTVANVTNSNGGAFCYATFVDANHNDFGASGSRNILGGDTSFKITLDGTATIVNFRPTLGVASYVTGISCLGFPSGARTFTGAHKGFTWTGYKTGDQGQMQYGTEWDAGESTTQTAFNRDNFTPQNAGVVSNYTLTSAIPATGFGYKLDDNNFPILVSGTGSFQGDTGGTQAGVFIDSKNYSVTVSSATTGGSIQITFTGAATVNGNGSISFPCRSTRLAGDNNRFTGRINLKTEQGFEQQTNRSVRTEQYGTDTNSDGVASNFKDPKFHVSMGFPWVKFDSTCKVEISHTSQGVGASGRIPKIESNVGIYKF